MLSPIFIQVRFVHTWNGTCLDCGAYWGEIMGRGDRKILMRCRDKKSALLDQSKSLSWLVEGSNGYMKPCQTHYLRDVGCETFPKLSIMTNSPAFEPKNGIGLSCFMNHNYLWGRDLARWGCFGLGVFFVLLLLLSVGSCFFVDACAALNKDIQWCMEMGLPTHHHSLT